MSSQKEDSSTFHTLQAERDLHANWEVDLAKTLEDYLLKICSGEITGTEEDGSQISVNFAEAALLLQGSVQVYSRKVEYLYNLVLHALDFVSQKRQQEQSEGAATQHEQGGSSEVPVEENDQFWCSDDVPVETRNCLDASSSKDASFYHYVKPPANLVVLEGDCIDSTADGGELESYLLATNDLYQGFILLDPCDAEAVNDYLKEGEIGKGQNGTHRSSSTPKSILSPTRCFGGTARKSSLGKNRDTGLRQSPMADCELGDKICEMGPELPAHDNFEDDNPGFDMDENLSDPGKFEDSDSSSDDDDDPWKPLNPHEPGNLKVKPFKKVKAFRRNWINLAKQISVTTLFPLARMHGTISPELTKIWETQCKKFERNRNSQSPPLYEKLRQSLSRGGHDPYENFGNADNDNEDNEYDDGINDFGLDDMPESMHVDENLPDHEKQDNGASNFDTETFENGEMSSQASLEDLCRSHLDALLANIAETEKQTELAARVSSWKQKIEHSLEEQDLRPPFDIHAYSERILDKLSLEEENKKVMSFADVVKGQEKHDVARTFSALLQLVNNGDVDLDRSRLGNESICYTAANPFCVRLLGQNKEREGNQFRLSKKSVKTPVMKGHNKNGKHQLRRETSRTDVPECGLTVASYQANCQFPVKVDKVGAIRCTPEGKRRRRSSLTC